MSQLTTKDNQKIHFEDGGQGKPVILIHGWPLSYAMWEYQAAPLMEHGYRVISYCRRGFGMSSKPLTGYNYDVFAEDLNEVITQLNLRDVNLIGFSMGGGEIARYLGKYGSDKVAKTVLISSVTPYLLKDESNPDGVDEKTFDDMKRQLKEDRPHFLAGFGKQFYGVGMISHPVSNEMLEWSNFLAYQASPKATIDCVDAFGKTDFRRDMASFTMPTLIIHGTADKTVPIDSSARQTKKMIPHATLKEYDGAAHGLFITHKNRLMEDLFMFLDN